MSIIRTVIPFCLMVLASTPFAQAYDPIAGFPFDPGSIPIGPIDPKPTCTYSFYYSHARYWIQISDAYGTKHQCKWKGYNESRQGVYECEDESAVLITYGRWGVKYVRFESSPELSAYCN